METRKENGLLKQALAEIPNLRTLHYRDGELTRWKDKVYAMLESVYGRDSAESHRFLNAPGRSFSIGTEAWQEQDYQRRLDCYEEALKALAG